MKFQFHIYLDKLEQTAKAAIADRPGLWESPRASMQSLRRVIVRPFKNLPEEAVIAEYVPPSAMRHIIESQPRVMLALIDVIRVIVERLAKHESALREARALLQRARRWVSDPKIGDEIETMLRVPTGKAALSAEGQPDTIPSSFDLEIEVSE